MARDYTKYNIAGLGENLNKRKLVYTIVKNWIEKNNLSLEELQNAFPDELQGKKGVVRKESEVKDSKRFNMKEPLSMKNKFENDKEFMLTLLEIFNFKHKNYVC
jgi:hypothetical protein